MDTSNTPNWVEIGSLFFSIIAIVWTWLTDRKLKNQQAKLNKQQEQINEWQLAKNKDENEAKNKAILIAETEGKSINAGIRISNKGLGEARNITFVSLENTIEPSNKEVLPITSIPSMESFKILCNFKAREGNLILKWEDDYDKDNKKEQSIVY